MNDATTYIDAATERLVLGTLLHGGIRLPELGPEDFGVESHRQIWASISRVSAEVELGCDSVAHDLTACGKLDSIGGLAMLMDLMGTQAIPGIPLAEFARMLKEKSAVRRIAKRARQIDGELAVHGLNGNAADIVQAAREIAELAESGGGRHQVIRSIADVPDVGDANSNGIAYLIEPELPMAAVIALTGDSGSGKSTQATAWLRSAIEAGHPALVLDRENPQGIIADRMDRLGLADRPLLRWWGGWLPEEAPAPDSRIVLDWVRSTKPSPVVLIDSVVAFFGGESENDAAAMRKFMHGPRRLADLGASVILIHHDGKADSARDFRGSSDFKAAVDVAFHVTNSSPDGKIDTLRLRCFKSRFGFSGDLVYRYAGGRMLRDDATGAPARTIADQLTALLRQNPGATAKDFEAKAHREGLGRNRARTFLNDGVLSGVIRRETGAQRAQHYYLAGVENEG